MVSRIIIVGINVRKWKNVINIVMNNVFEIGFLPNEIIQLKSVKHSFLAILPVS